MSVSETPQPGRAPIGRIEFVALMAMLVATVGLAHALRTLDTDRTALVGAVGAYVGLLVVYSF